MPKYSISIAKAPVCAHDLCQSVFCEHVSFTDISISVIDFLCGKVSSYDVRRSMCKNANERRYIDLLYYSRKYSHIFTYKDDIMTNTKLCILAIVTCAYMRVYAVCVILTIHLVRAK